VTANSVTGAREASFESMALAPPMFIFSRSKCVPIGLEPVSPVQDRKRDLPGRPIHR
jgi:hypothetical protein